MWVLIIPCSVVPHLVVVVAVVKSTVVLNLCLGDLYRQELDLIRLDPLVLEQVLDTALVETLLGQELPIRILIKDRAALDKDL